MPKVSICIPAYNQTIYLAKTLQSILAQTFDSYEIIVTDDSPGRMVEDMVGQFDFKGKLSYFHNQPALGSPANWNFCISKATGDYIKIMHHDDWFATPDSLKYFVETIEHSGAAMAFSAAEVVFEKNKKSGYHFPGAENILKLKKDPSTLFLGNFIGAPSMTMYRRDRQLEFDGHLKWLVDVDFYIRFLKKHKTFSYIDKPLISILADAEHTVTSICLSDKNIEIFENFYLFEKLKATFNFMQTINYSFLLFRLLHRFNISNLQEIKQSGYEDRLPFYFKTLFIVNKLSYKLIDVLKKTRRLILTPFKPLDAVK